MWSVVRSSMKITADLHIHSKYSRATSKDMEVRTLARYAEMKGINLLGTGDFTHPQYFSELRAALNPQGNGFFQLKGSESTVHFMLTAETSHIFSVQGKTKRVHMLLFAPSFEVVEKINRFLAGRGNIASDGRPIFGMHPKDLVKSCLDISPDIFFVPAHVWTPWFSVFGSASGFDSIEECFGEESKNIFAIETGLSSNPAMNWRLSKLDRITCISNSDSHSPSRIGREANVFDCAMDYREILDVIRTGDPKRFLYTVEFFPEEGKYHYDGHRDCGVVFDPKTSQEHQFLCPKCGKKLTIGVMHRVDELADRPEDFSPAGRIPFKNAVPLDEIIAGTFGKGVNTKTVKQEYDKMIRHLGPELEILLERDEETIREQADPRVAEGILNVREGRVRVEPGYDGVYGKVDAFCGKRGSSATRQKELFSGF